MKIIAKGRGKGKTTELIKMSAEKQIPIVCFYREEARHIEEQAKQMGLEIPKPVSNLDYLEEKDTSILIDNADIVLRNKFSGHPIEAITITTNDYNELEIEDISSYYDEIIKKLKDNVKKISDNLDKCDDYNKYIAGLKAIEKSLDIIHNFDWKPMYSKYKVDNKNDSGNHYEFATWEQNSENQIRNHKRYELKSPETLNKKVNLEREGIIVDSSGKRYMTNDEMNEFEDKFDKEMNSMKDMFRENLKVFDEINKFFDKICGVRYSNLGEVLINKLNLLDK
jgi:hypothetical protein